MIKVVCFFKRKQDITPEQFRDYYENHHVRLFDRFLNAPGLDRYVRRYLTPLADPISGVVRSSGFDVVMEVWFKDREAFDGFYQAPLDSEFLKLVAEDEEHLFDRDHLCFHTVDECDAVLQAKGDAAGSQTA